MLRTLCARDGLLPFKEKPEHEGCEDEGEHHHVQNRLRADDFFSFLGGEVFGGLLEHLKTRLLNLPTGVQARK